ncbi:MULTISPECIES: nucleobase:cation symporter-2 family protein [Acetobacter]|uniref:Purine permease n=1 Tax=Acetobacter tropicalis TaxID=104102 RepID=A0A291PJE5_9PROT|nr:MULTISPECIES: nucleobase:cation symporter-2 family protein [Acetobacter]ATJ91600.1 purine permease [Acetobacter tropicalis]
MNTVRTTSKAVHPVDEILPIWQLGVYGFQHVLTFYAAAVIVPILVAGALGLSHDTLEHLIEADLFTCGIASLLQAVGIGNIGVRLPLLQGVTFVAVMPMIAIGTAAGGGIVGLQQIFGSVIVAGVFSYFLAPHFSKLIRFFPPVVTGSVILIIGLALLPVAANDIVAGRGTTTMQDPVQLRNVAYGLGTLFCILGIQKFFRGFIGTIAILLGLVCGTLVAWMLGDAQFQDVSAAPLLTIARPFYFGLPSFHIVPIFSMIIVMIISMLETTGDVFATGAIVKKTISEKDIACAIRADGVATAIGGILNSFPYTCFAENVGLVRLTQIKSRWVVAAAAVIMIVLGCIPKLAAIMACVPLPVLGGAALSMFATVAVVGIQTLTKVDFDNQNNMIIVGTSVGLGMLATAQPHIADNFPHWAQIVFGSGITLGSMSAMVLHLIFNHFMTEKLQKSAINTHETSATVEAEFVSYPHTDH